MSLSANILLKESVTRSAYRTNKEPIFGGAA